MDEAGKMSSSWSVEMETQVSAVRLFKAGFTDWHNLATKIAPDIFISAEFLSGQGEPGSIRQLDFTPAVPIGFLKQRIDFIDQEKLEAKYTTVEGGKLGQTLALLVNHFRIEPKENGSIIRMEESYQIIPGVDIPEDLMLTKEAFIRSVKALEEYLLANPNTYV